MKKDQQMDILKARLAKYENIDSGFTSIKDTKTNDNSVNDFFSLATQFQEKEKELVRLAKIKPEEIAHLERSSLTSGIDNTVNMDSVQQIRDFKSQTNKNDNTVDTNKIVD